MIRSSIYLNFKPIKRGEGIENTVYLRDTSKGEKNQAKKRQGKTTNKIVGKSPKKSFI